MTKSPSNLGGYGMNADAAHAALARQLSLGNTVATASAALARQLSLGNTVGAASAALARQLSLGNTVGATSAGAVGTAANRLVLVPEPIALVTTPHDDRAVEDAPNSQRVDVVDEVDAFLERTLGELNPAFLAQFRGLMQRSEERGPDWWTQAAASGRKLFLGVLHSAAPDHLVLPWVTNRKQQLDRCKHPTRRTKIDWLCQSIRNEGYRKFVKTELDSSLALIDVLDVANHVDEFPEFEQSFSWTHLRVKVAIRHIVELWLKKNTAAASGSSSPCASWVLG